MGCRDEAKRRHPSMTGTWWSSPWPEGMTWRDYVDECPECHGPAPECGWHDDEVCARQETTDE